MWFIGLPPSELIGAIYSGILSSSQKSTVRASFDMNPSCPTGNCIYPLFQSLAICSTCEDVSRALTKNCESDSQPRRSYCQYSLPNGLGINKTRSDSQTGVVSSSGSLNPICTGTSYGYTLLNFTRIRGWYSDSWSCCSQASISTNVSATQCFLYWCVNTYESRVSNGHFSERIIDSWYSDKSDWWNDQEGYKEDPSNDRASLIPTRLGNDSDPKKNQNFTISRYGSDIATQFLSSKLSLSNSGSRAHIWDGTVYDSPFKDSIELVQAIRDSETNDLFANLAKSMTRSIRSVNTSSQLELYKAFYPWSPNDPSKFSPAHGTATYPHVYVSIRWRWIAFPVTLILLTAIFLAITMNDTMRHYTPIWKSSPLPLLFSSLDRNQAERLRKAKDLSEMERLSDEIKVELRDDSGSGTGARLVGEDREMEPVREHYFGAHSNSRNLSRSGFVHDHVDQVDLS